MSEREEPRPDPVRTTLADSAYRLVTEQGVEALTVRRLAEAAGTSTMAVYSRFGSIGAVAGEVCERGFAEFGAALADVGGSDDPVVDLMCQGLAYLKFATGHPLLYTLMFQYTSPEWVGSQRKSLLQHGNPTDSAAGRAAFQVMADAVRRVTEPGTDEGDILIRSGVAWSTVHGLAMLSIAGHLSGAHDLVARAALISLAVGGGTSRDAAERAFDDAARRMTDIGQRP
ncbi:TetR/AcrR family transcriptional regulator [Gordonia neofelifaecis]|uniref:TetR family transcriptional regulator n=1 Tax=Gordonia neofelifaecis NRRL B-59395 TaxID=644548 RepID=F1YMZ1_9ACTN|nr:TetR/AcrR family transcriptional regulator [Gordonia neofelifaecis]EGD53878.1 TetR family transcriptional regulator [Gordonia neofelifaecis NRRL B-59395]